MWPRLAAAARLARRSQSLDAVTVVRLGLLREHRDAIVALDGKEREVTRQLTVLVRASGSTLGQLCGLSTRSVAELLVEIGDPRRFTEGGFAHFNGTAPLPASTAKEARRVLKRHLSDVIYRRMIRDQAVREERTTDAA